MKVNTKSFHYKMYDYWYRRIADDKNPYVNRWGWDDYKRPENLCHYFRVVAIYVPFVFLIYTLFTLMMLGAVGVVGWLAFTKLVWREVLFVLAWAFGVLIIGGGLILVALWIKDNAGKAIFDPDYEPKSILVARVKAKKSKVCPQIEFEDAK